MSKTSLSARDRAPLVTDAIPPGLWRQGANPRQVLAMCLIGAIVLALFASRDTPSWAERLGDSALDHRIRDVVGAWDERMEALGFTRPHEALRAAMQRVLDWQWNGGNQ
jgi:hypothetical protein